MPDNDTQHAGLKLKKNYYKTAAEPEPEAPQNPAEPQSQADSTPTPFHRKRDSSAAKRQNIMILASWALGIILNAGLIYLRFFAVLPAHVFESVKLYGMIAVGIAYGISIALAIRDNMFDGLLAIVVPLYPFYYLYTTSGSIFMRAIATALLAAFGYDCALLVQKYALKIFDGILQWISHF